MKRWDIIIIAALLLCAGALAWARLALATSGTGATVEILVKGELAQVLPLSGDERTVRVDGAVGSLTVSVGPDGVAVTEANCPSQDCVRTGRVTMPGECVACLPNQVLVKITGGGQDNTKTPGTSRTEVDAVAQ